ncbi:MAG: proline--tRNA ligase [Candidatus Jordarchaeales archaeon]|nr:proline--tRNA ligase [Candidatus Jordarchaeia archaeon]
MSETDKTPLPNKYENFNEWYNEILQKAELIDLRYGVKGFIVYRPNAAVIMRQVYRLFEEELDRLGHAPCIFPVVIPFEFFEKEAQHIKGFLDEVFWVTKAGQHELNKPLLLRPTSETAMYPLYAFWIRSYKDLPLKLYQSNSVYRYETKATKPLLRGREFFWIEAHCAHRTKENAERQVLEDMEVMSNALHEVLGVPFLLLERPPWDRFAGAERTYAFDVVFPDKSVLQIATTHILGENFSRAFEIMYKDEDGELKYVQQTCFGIGISRILATLISVHGDEYGLVLPFDIAPTQIVIVPILFKEAGGIVMEKCKAIFEKLCEKGYRVMLDDSDERPGAKFYRWETLGVPVRIEIGPRDVEKGVVTVFRRDTRERIVVRENELEEKIKELRKDILRVLRERGEKWLEANLRDVKSKDDLIMLAREGGIGRMAFCGREECASEIKAETGGFEVRGVRVGEKWEKLSVCAACGKEAKELVYVAKPY